MFYQAHEKSNLAFTPATFTRTSTQGEGLDRRGLISQVLVFGSGETLFRREGKNRAEYVISM